MEEIINRWTTDLEKYKSEFVQQASEVKKWDGVLIENGDKIMTLYTETLEAEKTQGRMDTVLQQLESDQEELGTALDYYEAQIKDLFEAQMGGVEGMQPADQEREKAYHLAEKLDDQLQGMGTELQGMIKEINRASTTINKTTNADDPVGFLVPLFYFGSVLMIITNSSRKSSRFSMTTCRVCSGSIAILPSWRRRFKTRRRSRGMRLGGRWAAMRTFSLTRVIGA